MGVAWGRLGLVAVVLLVALPVATWARGGEAGPVPERDTSCWPCHVTWPTPLKTFYNMLPPPEAGAAVGTPFDFVVQLQNVWTPPKDGPYILYYEPALNLTGAPSLGFFSNTPPLAFEETGTIDFNPSAPTEPARSPHVVTIPEGATTLTIVLTPGETNPTIGPDLALNIQTPKGVIHHDEAGRGQPEVFTLEGTAAFLETGYGNWTVEAEWTPIRVSADDVTAIVGPPAASQSYTLNVDAAVQDTGERIQAQPHIERIAKGGASLFRYRLVANAEPAPGEAIRLVVNATVYYKHDPGSSDYDWANVTKAYPGEIPVTLADGRVVLRTDVSQNTIVGSGVQNGATLDTISEAIGYGAAFLLISSVWTGGMFGKASRRQLNGVFGTAKRRVAFHNFLSYGIILFATLHTVLFIVETAYYWTLGVLWGGLAILAMFLLGVTGAWQVQMIRRWNYGFWRWSHYGLAVASIVFTLVHMALDGVHFGDIQDALNWNDPLDNRENI